MRKAIAIVALLICASSVTVSRADITLFDIDADPGAWANAIAGLTASTSYNFDLDADYGVAGFDGPLTSAGGGPVSPGILPADMVMDSEMDGPGGPGRGAGGTGLVGVGPAAGFGNPSNSVLANFFVDAFKVDLTTAKVAFAFNALTLLGSDTVDILVTDDLGGTTMFAGVSVAAGRNLGLLGINGQNIASISIHDAGGGAEGVQGIGQSYTGFVIPEPGSAALLSILAMGLVIRRRSR